MGIQTRTLLGRSARQVTMPNNLCLWKELVQVDEQIGDSLLLLRSHGIARFPLLIQPSLVTDADGASIIRYAMGTDLQEHAMLTFLPILTDIEVITDATEVASQMVTEQHFLRIVLVASRSRAMQNQILNVLCRHILLLFHNRIIIND